MQGVTAGAVGAGCPHGVGSEPARQDRERCRIKGAGAQGEQEPLSPGASRAGGAGPAPLAGTVPMSPARPVSLGRLRAPPGNTPVPAGLSCARGSPCPCSWEGLELLRSGSRALRKRAGLEQGCPGAKHGPLKGEQSGEGSAGRISKPSTEDPQGCVLTVCAFQLNKTNLADDCV